MAASATQVPSAAPGPLPPGVDTNVPNQPMVRFVQAASPPRFQISSATATTALTGGQQSLPLTLPGSGYMTQLDLQYVFTAGSATATTVNAEDCPWSAAALITLDDGGPQNVNIDGFSLYLQNVYGGVGIRDNAGSTDAVNVYQQLGTGTGNSSTTGGNGLFWLTIPLAINNRNYWGLMGNQDRATKYNLRDDMAGTASIWTTPPSTVPTLAINRVYGYLPVPGPVAADGRKQEQVPPGYGIIHYLTSIRSDAAPSPSSTVNHYIRNLSNAVRMFILIFRAGTGTTPRSTAASNAPTQIDFVVGTDTVWSESYAHRRKTMWDRYRVDAPNGVLVYDGIRDFSALAGYELGDQYLFMGNISEAQFRITYPSGFTAGGSLTIVTDSLYIPPGIDIYGAAS